MKLFFPDINALDQFTRELDCHRNCLPCRVCRQSQHFVSHGFVYKKQYHGEKIKVGKRLFCSDRYGRSGCGATLRLYLTETLPRLRYGVAQLHAFLLALIDGASIPSAYQAATQCVDPRNAYRWLYKLACRLPAYRSLLNFPCRCTGPFAQRVKRLQLLLPTLQTLFAVIGDGAAYQQSRQERFI